MSARDRFEKIFALILDSDFGGANVLASYALPNDVSSFHERTIEGPFLLQIESISNIGVPYEKRKLDAARAERQQRRKHREINAQEENEEERRRRTEVLSSDEDEDEHPDWNGGGGGRSSYSKRMLKVRLSDGRKSVSGIETTTIPNLDYTSVGQKVIVKNVRVLRGLLLLDPESAVVMGGNLYLDHLEEGKRSENDGATALRSQRSGASTKTGGGALAAAVRTESSADAVVPDDESDVDDWSDNSDHDALLTEISSMEARHNESSKRRAASSVVSCSRCTFENAAGRRNCEMCDAPL